MSPLCVAAPEASLALLALLVGLAASIRWPMVIAVASSLLLVALLQAVRAVVALGRRRRVADEWLLWGAVARPSSGLLEWRAAELVSPRLRATLGANLRQIEREVEHSLVPGPVPLNRQALRCHMALVRTLSDRVKDPVRPVSVRGMLLVDRLLTEPGSPLYSHASDDVLAEALGDALAALDPALSAAAA